MLCPQRQRHHAHRRNRQQVGNFIILIQTTIDYATLVQRTNSTLQHPQIVRKCVQYFSSHAHENMALEQLTEGSEYFKEYIAKLFRKHMGITPKLYRNLLKSDSTSDNTSPYI